jgi:hypothetical protein
LAFKIKFTLCFTMSKTHHGALPYTKLQTITVRYWEMEKFVRPVLGLRPMHASRVKSQTVGNTDLDSGTPSVQSLYHFFPQNWSLGSKGPRILLSKQQNQGTKCVVWHMKQSIWSTDLERPVTSHNFPGPQIWALQS